MASELSTFATGIRMGESPRWHDGRFWTCDCLAGEVLVFADDGRRAAGRSALSLSTAAR